MVGNDADPAATKAPSLAAATIFTADVPRSIPNTSGWEPGSVAGCRRASVCGSAMGAHGFHNRAGSLQRLIDIVVRMREGDEQVFERMGVKQHAAVQHSLPPPPEAFMVRVTGGVAVVADRMLGEPHLQHRADSHDVRAEPGIVLDSLEAGEQSPATSVQPLVYAGLRQLVQR